MTDLPTGPGGRRNRIGCFVISAVLVIFIALYALIGFNAEPGNTLTEDIQTLPATSG